MKFGNIAGRGVGSGRSCSLFNEFKLRSIKNNEIYIGLAKQQERIRSITWVEESKTVRKQERTDDNKRHDRDWHNRKARCYFVFILTPKANTREEEREWKATMTSWVKTVDSRFVAAAQNKKKKTSYDRAAEGEAK